MPNIAIVNYCNLKCQYCFADDMIQEESTSITLDDYKKILEFCSRHPMYAHIGIIGGEPTLHPNFNEILKETNIYCREVNTDATLFTNGIELDKYLPNIGERIGILINVNHPDAQGPEKFKKLIALLDHLYELSWLDQRANLGCNVHMGCDDYSFIWEIVDKYHIQHLRCSVVSPGGCYHEWRKEKEKYYNVLKPKYLQFCKDAIQHKCVLGMDCGHIPDCYFTSEEMQIVREACGIPAEAGPCGVTNNFCEPVIDIKSDFKATACFGAYDPIDIRDFESPDELHRYLLLKKNYVRAMANTTGKCSTCKKAKLLQCQGGCLGFAEV